MKQFLALGLIATSAIALASQTKSICGSLDSRVSSDDPAVGRLLTHAAGKDACTGTLISTRCAITAGHCNAYSLMEFNTPLSKNGWMVHSAAEDIYERDQLFGRNDTTVGMDWLVFSLKPNRITGELPGTIQGFYSIDWQKPTASTVRVTGYGMDRDSTLTYTQQTASDALVAIDEFTHVIDHRVDTYGGNSGSAIIDSDTSKIIGIHTHGDCVDSDSFPKSTNMGTLIWQNAPLIKAIQDCLASE